MPDVMSLETAEKSLDRRSDLQKEVDKIILEDVKRGMILLREKYGEDWIDHIDPTIFNIREGAVCVLGQVCPAVDPNYNELKGNGYDWAYYEWPEEDPDFNMIAHGFAGRNYGELEMNDFGNPVHGESWAQLQRVWETVFEMVGIRKG